MANKVVGSLSSFAAALLSILWIVTLLCPWTWIWTDNAVVAFKVGLHKIYVGKGTAGMAASVLAHAADYAFGTKWANSLAEFMDKSFWMEEGVQQMCMVGVDSIWHWCDTWVMVKYGSIIFVFLGFMTALFLAMGSAFTYYYAHNHATHTGRMWIRVCLVTAPCCAWVGLLQYIMLTFWLGKGERQIIAETRANYGPGFIVGCALTLLSAVPIYVHGIFSKVDEFEKHGDNDVFLEDGAAGPNYGAAQPYPAYNAAPAPTPYQGYSQAPPQAGYGAPPQAGYGAPPPTGGYGAPPPMGVGSW